MKKLLFIALISIQYMNAQQPADSLPSQEILKRKNEVRTDVISLVGSSRLNLTYERFFNKDFSAGVSFGYADSEKVNDDFDSGYRNTRPKYDVTPFVRYNLSKSLSSFYFAEVFISANGGDFKKIERRNNGVNDYFVTEKSAYSDFGIGAGLGYKLYIKDQFGIEFMVGFGTNLFDKDKSPDTISRVGLSLGYRF